MPTIFSRIISSELPGHFLWRDEHCVVFLSINPIQDGHALVVPIAEVDHWLDLDAETVTHLTEVAKIVGEAQTKVFNPPRVGLVIAGFEVPHTHVHVLPTSNMADFDFANAASSVDHEQLADFAEQLRAQLIVAGHEANVSDA